MSKKDGMPSMSAALITRGSGVAARIISSVAGPLGYVHGEGFVHGDVKPDNIMAERMGRASLIDFGATTPRPYGHLIDSGQMVEGSVEHIEARNHMQKYRRPLTGDRTVCSAEYMSPEQANNQRVDITSDFYSLGITAYELFYGRVPFQVETVRTAPASPEDEVFDAVITPKRQREQRLAELHKEAKIDLTVPEGKEIPTAVIGLIERATQKNPQDRYQSAEELLEDMEIILHATRTRP
jgi:serine/threonine-protein kinase